MNITIADVKCPKCGALEMHPDGSNRLTIRAHKVHDGKAWRSQCLVCSGYYDENLKETSLLWDRTKGWF